MKETSIRSTVYAMMVAIVTLSSCAGEESEIQQSPPVPITVTVNNSNSPQTRDDETTPYNSLPDLQTTGFGLYCQPGGLDPLMNNQKFTYSTTNGWTYSPIKYWPSGTGTGLNFIAYAPYTTTNKVSYDKTGQKLSYVYTVNTASPFDNIDLCTAVAANQTNSSSAVALAFQHHTARLDVKVTVNHTDYDENNKLYYKYFIKSVTIETYSKKTQTLQVGLTGSPSWAWVSDDNGEDLTYNISSFPEGIGDPDPEIGTVAAFQAATSTLNNTNESRIFPDSKYLTILPSTSSVTITVQYVEYSVSATTDPVGYVLSTPIVRTKEISSSSLTIAGGHLYTLNITLDPSSDTTITP